MTEDIYLKTASETFGVPVEGVTESQRRFAKDICFGKAYGGRTVECRILTSNLRTALHLALDRLNEQDRGSTGLAKGLEDILAAMNRGERIVVRDE